MTTAFAELDSSVSALHRVLPSAGYGVTAAALAGGDCAKWTRAHGVTVYAQDDDDLDLIAHNSIRPVQVVLQCGSTPDTIRRAVRSGVSRFIVCNREEAQLLARFAHRTKYVYLGAGAPVPEPNRRLQIIGLHSEVDDSSGRVEWACATERLVCRMAYLRSCALRPIRLSLTAGTAGTLSEKTMTVIASMVDEALDEGCERWGLARPKILLSPGPVAELSLAA